MAYNEKLADRIREALAHLPKVEEKIMFRGVTFMVDGKMCISVSGENIMCRFAPADHDKIADKEYTHEMLRNSKAIKGYIYVSEEGTKTKKQLDYWIKACLDFNKDAKASKKISKRK
jgi:TfoX/Sxy family transcriptional regulator of competence genes